MLEHGGKLRQAAALFNIELENWIDLSTGINPYGWKVGNIPANCWSRLPEDEDGLLATAKRYYNTEHLLAVAGTQAAIQIIPGLLRKRRVGMLSPTYSEHVQAWEAAGHEVISLGPTQIDEHIDSLDILVLVNPNNPTANLFSQSRMLGWHEKLKARNALFIVDEAFIDPTPEASLVSIKARPNLIILRSIGKFFGLAGIRAGFVHAQPHILNELQRKLGPWSIAGASRYVAEQALMDIEWQEQTRIELSLHAARLNNLLLGAGFNPTGSNTLFQWVKTSRAHTIYQSLAKKGILVRYFAQPSSVRFGLPGTEPQWQRLEQALENLRAYLAELEETDLA